VQDVKGGDGYGTVANVQRVSSCRPRVEKRCEGNKEGEKRYRFKGGNPATPAYREGVKRSASQPERGGSEKEGNRSNSAKSGYTASIG